MIEQRFATVLVVDDNRELADVYAETLDDTVETVTAYSGPDALESLDETIDIVLLDRRMPQLSGDDVLEAIEDRRLECRVLIVTAVDPDFDILDLSFDEYLQKPVRGEELIAAIDRQLVLRNYDEQATEYVELQSKLDALASSKSPLELQRDSRYDDLAEQVDELAKDIDPSVTDLCNV